MCVSLHHAFLRRRRHFACEAPEFHRDALLFGAAECAARVQCWFNQCAHCPAQQFPLGPSSMSTVILESVSYFCIINQPEKAG